jgi:hypothetical protein
MKELEINQPLGHAAQVDMSREVAQVQGQIVMAHKFPRRETQVLINIEEACRRVSLAKLSTYAFPRGGKTITGPSIRLAETIVRYYGNVDYGVRELEQKEGRSIIQAYAWDLETNLRVTKEFTVSHDRKAHNKIERLTDPRDIYELVANNGARRVRACILGIIPPDITERALEVCKMTLIEDSKGNDTRPIRDRIANLVKAFNSLGIKEDLIIERLDHGIDEMDLEEFYEYVTIYNSIKDGQTKRDQWFKIKRSEQSADLSSTEKLKKLQEEKPKEQDEPVPFT